MDEHAFAESGGLFDMDLQPEAILLAYDGFALLEIRGRLENRSAWHRFFQPHPGSYRVHAAVGGA